MVTFGGEYIKRTSVYVMWHLICDLLGLILYAGKFGRWEGGRFYRLIFQKSILFTVKNVNCGGHY